MHYPIVMHKDKASDYGVIVPDLPGCFSAGSTVDEALAMAQEAIELHLEGLIEDGQVIPEPTSIENHKSNRDYAGGTWALVTVDESKLRINAQRLSITMPERALDAIDRYAHEHGETRSGLLTRAALAYIGRSEEDMPTPKRGKPRKRTRKEK